MKSVYQRAEISVKKTGGVQLEPAQPGEVYRLAGKEYPVSAHVKFQGGGSVPLVDLPMMSDYTWQLGALKSRLEHPEVYAKFENVEETVARLRQWLAENAAFASRKGEDNPCRTKRKRPWKRQLPRAQK